MARNLSRPSLRSSRTPGWRVQRGVVLVTALIFLALILLLGVSASRGSLLLSAVAANERAVSMAEGGSNAALRRAEKFLYDAYTRSNGVSLVGDASASMGVYSPDSPAAQSHLASFSTPDRWVTEGSTTLADTDVDFTKSIDATARLAEQPAFMIEDLGLARPGGFAGESGATGTSNYSGSSGIGGGNATLRIYRITAKSPGPTTQLIKTLQSVYAGHAGS